MRYLFSTLLVLATLSGCGFGQKDSSNSESLSLQLNREASTVFARRQDCEAIIRRMASKCSGEDCEAVIYSRVNSCTTRDCRAMVQRSSGACETDDCRAVVDHDQAYCVSNNCRAIVNRQFAQCRNS